MEISDFFFPHSGSYVRLQLQIPSGENTWHNEVKRSQCRVCSWQGNHSCCPWAGLRDGSQHLWVSDCCFPGTAAQPGLQPRHYFQSSIKLCPYQAAQPIMTLFWKLILSEVISSSSLYAKQTDRAVLGKGVSVSSSSFTHTPCLHLLQSSFPYTSGYNNMG